MQLELRGITKRFGSLTANDHISLMVEPGQIHSLLGENGAGKSTLMNVLFGLLSPDEGEILIDGEVVPDQPTRVRRCAAASAWSTSTSCWCRSSPLPRTSCSASSPPSHSTASTTAGPTRRFASSSRKFGLEVDPLAVVENLPVGLQQRVEILKALSHDAELLILDEPTAVLTPQEIDSLMAIMRSLAAAGKSILFITHKLKEVKAIADVITVIRQGRVVGTAEPTASESELASMMVGREVTLTVEKTPYNPGEPVLEVRDLVVLDDRGLVAVNGVSLEVRAGEVLALAGVQGNGQTELVEALVGMRPVISGTVTLNGHDVTHLTPRQALDAGFGHIPEDRQRDGLVLSMSVADNLVLNTPRRAPFARRGTRNFAADQRTRRAVGPRLRHPRDLDPSAGELALGRQPAEGHRGPRALEGHRVPRRLPADARSRRRLDRVRAPPDRRASQSRAWFADRLVGTRRGARPRRPDRGDVRGQDQRRRRPDDVERESIGLLMAGTTMADGRCLTRRRRSDPRSGSATPRAGPSSWPLSRCCSGWSSAR